MNYIKENPVTVAMWGLGIVIVMMISFYLSSITYFLLAGFDPDTATPFSIFRFIRITYDPYGMYLAISFIVPNIILTAMAAMLIFRPQSTDAHWANSSDIKKAKLNKKTGILLGKYKGNFLYDDDTTHAFVVAPSRSGKGLGLVIPNLLAWDGSFICLDVKGENHKFTSGYHTSLGKKVINFAPFSLDETSHCYNPLDYVSKNKNRRITDLQILAKLLITTENTREAHFPKEGRILFLGLALYIFDNEDYPNTIGAIYRLLGTSHNLGKIFKHILDTNPELDKTAIQLFNSFTNKAEKERSGIISTLSTSLELWANPVIDAVTSKSDFSFHELRTRRHCIYLGINIADMETLAPLMRIFFEQAITTLSMYEPDPKKEPHKILILLDEIHTLGNIRIITKAFTLLAGYRIRMIGVVQDLNILEETYTRQICANILANCYHQVFFATKDTLTRKFISDSCGMKTVKSKSISKARGFSTEKARISITEKIVPLIREDEVNIKLSTDKQIILIDRNQPVLCKKINYRNEKCFKNDILPPAKTPPINIKLQESPTFDIPLNDNNTNGGYAKPNNDQPPNKNKLYNNVGVKSENGS